MSGKNKAIQKKHKHIIHHHTHHIDIPGDKAVDN